MPVFPEQEYTPALFTDRRGGQAIPSGDRLSVQLWHDRDHPSVFYFLCGGMVLGGRPASGAERPSGQPGACSTVPGCPFTGQGGVLVLILLKKVRERPVVTFFLTMLICGCVEYATSWVLEMIHHGVRWWDYSGYFLNLNGRVCAEGLLIFGLGGCGFIYILAPLVMNGLHQTDTGEAQGASLRSPDPALCGATFCIPAPIPTQVRGLPGTGRNTGGKRCAAFRNRIRQKAPASPLCFFERYTRRGHDREEDQHAE